MSWIPEYILSAGNVSILGSLRKGLKNKENLTAEDVTAYKYSFQQGE